MRCGSGKHVFISRCMALIFTCVATLNKLLQRSSEISLANVSRSAWLDILEHVFVASTLYMLEYNESISRTDILRSSPMYMASIWIQRWLAGLVSNPSRFVVIENVEACMFWPPSKLLERRLVAHGLPTKSVFLFSGI